MIITCDAELIDSRHESSPTIQKQRTSDVIFVPPLSITTPSQIVIERKVSQDVIEEESIEVSKTQKESNHFEIQEKPQLRRSERTTRGIMNRYMRENYAFGLTGVAVDLSRHCKSGQSRVGLVVADFVTKQSQCAKLRHDLVKESQQRKHTTNHHCSSGNYEFLKATTL